MAVAGECTYFDLTAHRLCHEEVLCEVGDSLANLLTVQHAEELSLLLVS